MRKILLTLFGIFTFITLINAQTYEIILQPGTEGKDAVLSSMSNTNNYESYKNVIATAWTNGGQLVVLRLLFQFDLSSIPVGANITEANL